MEKFVIIDIVCVLKEIFIFWKMRAVIDNR
jgi:hypothetical protein